MAKVHLEKRGSSRSESGRCASVKEEYRSYSGSVSNEVTGGRSASKKSKSVMRNSADQQSAALIRLANR